MSKTDAWILAAIESIAMGREKPITLDELVSSADYINRLIPSATEVEEAVSNLGKTGLVQVQNRRFRVTSDGEAWLDRFGWASGRDVISVWMKLADAWNGQELPLKDPSFDFRLEPSELGRAVAAHRRSVQEWLAKEKRRSGRDRGHGAR